MASLSEPRLALPLSLQGAMNENPYTSPPIRWLLAGLMFLAVITSAAAIGAAASDPAVPVLEQVLVAR